MARAGSFIRYDGADGTGHAGWAFDLDADTTDCGAVEDPLGLPSCDPADMGFWNLETPAPVATMLQHAPPYNALKYFDLDPTHVDVELAQTTVAWVSQQWYVLIGRNCMDDVYDVLRAFGIPNLPPPVLHWFPNDWFGALEGILEPMTFEWRPQPGVPAAQPAMAATKPAIVPKAPAWRVEGTPEWQDLQAQMAAQSGYPSIRRRAERYARLQGE